MHFLATETRQINKLPVGARAVRNTNNRNTQIILWFGGQSPPNQNEQAKRTFGLFRVHHKGKPPAPVDSSNHVYLALLIF